MLGIDGVVRTYNCIELESEEKWYFPITAYLNNIAEQTAWQFIRMDSEKLYHLAVQRRICNITHLYTLQQRLIYGEINYFNNQ